MNVWEYLNWIHEGFGTVGSALIDFTFYYPLFMSYVWMIGGIHYYLRFERDYTRLETPPPQYVYPGVSVLVPLHNEQDNVRETVAQLLRQRYPDLEIILVNDGSTDATGRMLDQLAVEHPKLRVLHLARNQGKAIALNMGALVSGNEFIVCIDGDALLEENAVLWFMHHLTSGPRVGAVTGNPRVRNRSTLLGKVQVGEFSSIVGLIKRTQRVYGRVFTVSGVACAFRKRALHDVGYWSPNMLTEDIDVSWKLQLHHWDVRFEPKALCWILMPETLKGLWTQRLRWAMGGFQVLLKYSRSLLSWRRRRMWMIYVEFVLSIMWAYSMALVFMLWMYGKLFEVPETMAIPTLLPGWTGALIGTTCLLQIFIAICLDSTYDRKLGRVYYWMIWYPLLYWIINMLTTVWAVPAALLRNRHARAVWVSPDRGVKSS